MRIAALTAGAIAMLTMTAAFADPIAERKALMKQNGRAVGSVAAIAKGEKPFDAAAVKAAFDTLAEDARNFDAETLFPPGSDQGDTTASPKIWSDRAAFAAAIEKFRADTAAAVEADVQDLEAFRTQFNAVAANCGSCHQAFRIQKG